MNKARPNSVKIAVGCLVVSYGSDSIQTALRINWSDFHPYIVGVFGLLIGWLLVIMIYQRKTWARWLYAGFTAAGLLMLAAHFNYRVNGVTSFLWLLYLILSLTAAIMLFTPTSNDWFKTHGKSA
jgi:peptidoglycan/LPS O-acetylase OafA/YrhL